MFGRKVGPTGRKRDEFGIFALNKQGHELNKPYRGSYAYQAYGQEGVREAKKSVHKKFPHKWVKFSTYNHSRTTRLVHKRWEASKKKGKK